MNERARPAEELRKAERQRDQILERITDSFVAYDVDWRYAYLNREALARMSDAKGKPLSRKDLLGKRAWDVFPELVGTKFYDELHRSVRERRRRSFDYFYPPRQRWFEITAYPDSGSGVTVYSRDVTEGRVADERLKYQASLLDIIDDAVVGTDLEFRITIWNAGAERLYGYTADEVIGEEARSVASYRGDRSRLELERELLVGGRTRTEITAYRKDGTRVEVELSSVAVRDGDGEITGYLGIHRDSTDRKAAEEQLAYHARLLALIEDAVIATDDQFVIAAWNLGAEHMFGWTAAEAVGRKVPELVRAQWSDEELQRAMSALTETGRWRGEVNSYGKDGAAVDTDALATALPASAGGGYVCILRDASERRRAARELERRERQQAAVAELGVRALAGVGARELTDDAVTLVRRTLDVEYASIWELQPGGDELVMRAGVGWPEGTVGNERIPSGRESQSGYSLLIREPLIVDDMGSERRFDVPPLLREHGIASGASVTIDPMGKPFGTLSALSTSRRSFSEDDIAFLQSVANVIAAAAEREDIDAKLEAAREEERRRIAREHEETLRDLATAIEIAQHAEAAATRGETGEQLAALVSSVVVVRQRLRIAIFDLCLGADAHRPFAEQLGALVSLYRPIAGAEIELDVRDGGIGSLGPRGAQLLRIASEALSNATAYSAAKTIRVALWDSTGEVVLEIRDDGQGFDSATRPAGPGIRWMRERAEMIGAELTLSSETGNGTSVRVNFSLAKPPPERETVRVLLVDSQAAVRQALAAAFEQQDDFDVVAQAGSLEEARGGLQHVDVAVVDLTLPDGYGGDLISELRRANPEAQALVLSAGLDRAAIARAVQNGAAGALDKTADLAEVVSAVRRLRAGETLLPLDEVVELLRLASRNREQELADRRAIALLTPRELEVLQALADGLDSAGAAARLHITVRTERNHIANVMSKLGVHSRLQALVLALHYDVVAIS